MVSNVLFIKSCAASLSACLIRSIDETVTFFAVGAARHYARILRNLKNKVLMDAKKLRSTQEINKRSLHGAVTKIYVAIVLCVPEKNVQIWLEKSTSFPRFLKVFALEHLEDREDICHWEKGLCQIISDLALREMTSKEQKRRDIFLPREIIFWFADFLERTFSKPQMRWDSSFFSEATVLPITEELRLLAEQKQVSNFSSTLTAAKSLEAHV